MIFVSQEWDGSRWVSFEDYQRLTSLIRDFLNENDPGDQLRAKLEIILHQTMGIFMPIDIHRIVENRIPCEICHLNIGVGGYQLELQSGTKYFCRDHWTELLSPTPEKILKLIEEQHDR